MGEHRGTTLPHASACTHDGPSRGVAWTIAIVFATSACTDVRDAPTVEHVDGSTSSTGGTGTSSDDTTGADAAADDAGGSEVESSCGELCTRKIDCGIDVDAYLCALACAQDLLPWADVPGCASAKVDEFACATGLACDELTAYLVDPKAGPCGGQADAASAVCDPTCDLVTSTGNPAAMTCGAVFECGVDQRTIDCASGQCVCAIAGVTVEMCERPGECSGEAASVPGYWENAGETCCRWTGLVDEAG